MIYVNTVLYHMSKDVISKVPIRDWRWKHEVILIILSLLSSGVLLLCSKEFYVYINW